MSIRTCCLGALLLVVSAACTSGPPPPDETVQVKDIDAHRAAVDRFMRENKDSPIPPERRGSLLPLQYFPVDPGYSVPAELKVRNALRIPKDTKPSLFFEQYDTDPVLDLADEALLEDCRQRLRRAGVALDAAAVV